jgi:hypothetical protein
VTEQQQFDAAQVEIAAYASGGVWGIPAHTAVSLSAANLDEYMGWGETEVDVAYVRSYVRVTQFIRRGIHLTYDEVGGTWYLGILTPPECPSEPEPCRLFVADDVHEFDDPLRAVVESPPATHAQCRTGDGSGPDHLHG